MRYFHQYAIDSEDVLIEAHYEYAVEPINSDDDFTDDELDIGNLKND